jgi:hypothetical protein
MTAFLVKNSHCLLPSVYSLLRASNVTESHLSHAVTALSFPFIDGLALHQMSSEFTKYTTDVLQAFKGVYLKLCRVKLLFAGYRLSDQ